MEHITFTNEVSQQFVFDVGQLITLLEKVTNLRKAKGKQYSLPLLLVSILLAKLSGEQKPTGITEWIKLRRRPLMEAFQCARQTAPSLDTIRRTMENTVLAEELHKAFRPSFIKKLVGNKQYWSRYMARHCEGRCPKEKPEWFIYWPPTCQKRALS